MKKLINTILLISILFSTLTTTPIANAVDNYSVILNGQKLEFDQPPVMKDDRILVPFRVILEAMNADVYYDSENNAHFSDDIHDWCSINAIKNDIALQINKINGKWSFAKTSLQHRHFEKVEFDVFPIILNGRTLVPIRVLTECFGANVSWDGTTGTVNITADVSGSRKSAEEIKKYDNFTCTEAETLIRDNGISISDQLYPLPEFDTKGKFFAFHTFDENDNYIGVVKVYYDGSIVHEEGQTIQSSSNKTTNTSYTKYSGKWDWDKSEPLLDNQENWYTYDEAWVDIKLTDNDDFVKVQYYHQMGGTHLYTYDECIGYIQGNKITAKTKARKGDQAFDDFTITCTFYDDMMWLEAYNDTQGGLAFGGTFYNSSIAHENGNSYNKYIGTYSKIGGSLGFKWGLSINSISNDGITFSFSYEKPGSTYISDKAIFINDNTAIANGKMIFETFDSTRTETNISYIITLKDDGIEISIPDSSTVEFKLSDKI